MALTMSQTVRPERVPRRLPILRQWLCVYSGLLTFSMRAISAASCAFSLSAALRPL